MRTTYLLTQLALFGSFTSPQSDSLAHEHLSLATDSATAVLEAARSDGRRSKSLDTIAVVGSNAFAAAIINLLPGKTIEKRKVKVIILDPTLAAQATKQQHQLLYVATNVDQAVVARIIANHAKLATTLMSSRPAQTRNRT